MRVNKDLCGSLWIYLNISTIRNLNNFTKVFDFNSSYITVINSTFKYNSGLLSIFSINNSHITFINCKFSQNEGSVLIGVLSPSITIKSCTFKTNKAAVGAVLLLYGVLRSNLTNSTFIQNTAKIGGIIFASNSTGLYISECRFMSNYAGRGSVIFGQFLKSIEIRELSFFTGRGGPSVCDFRSPIFSGPPLCIRKKILVPPFAYGEKCWSPPL